MSENNENFQETPIIDMLLDDETMVIESDNSNNESDNAADKTDNNATAQVSQTESQNESQAEAHTDSSEEPQQEPNNDLIVDMGNPATTPSIIKVIGVGGGGGNAVNYMYRTGIKEVNFAVCNTDSKALQDSPVPYKVQLGKDGLGAGNRPERARQAANESIEQIRDLLDANTKMVFITAGMGGGTGTGAALSLLTKPNNAASSLSASSLFLSNSKATRKSTKPSMESTPLPKKSTHYSSSTTSCFAPFIPISPSVLPLRKPTPPSPQQHAPSLRLSRCTASSTSTSKMFAPCCAKVASP